MADPIQPFSLPAPAVVPQSTQVTCWAACFRSLNRTSGSSLNLSEAQLQAVYQQFLTPNGISGRGLRAEVHTLGMTFRSMRGASFSLSQMRNALQNGHVILGFIFPHAAGTPRLGHVVVAYGVSSQGVQVMNPDPVGPTLLTEQFLKSCPRVVIGTSIFGMAPTGTNPFSGMGVGR